MVIPTFEIDLMEKRRNEKRKKKPKNKPAKKLKPNKRTPTCVFKEWTLFSVSVCSEK